MLTVGRISYLPDDAALRNIRYTSQLKSYNNLKDVLPDGISVVKVAQQYRQEELNTDEIVLEYEKLGVSKARNVLLKEFYNSNSDYLLLLDDDNSFYPYYNIKGLFESIHRNSKPFVENNIHIIRAVEPQYTPFKKDNAALGCDEKFVFKQAPLSDATGLYLLVNFKKYFNREFYFDESLKVNKDPDAECEILDFEIRIMQEGFNILQCRNMIQKNQNAQTGRSTVFEGSDDVDKAFKVMYHNTARRFGIPIESGRVKFSKCLDFYKGNLFMKYDLSEVYRDKPDDNNLKLF